MPERVPFMVCCELYRRKVPWLTTVIPLACQLPKGHDGEHSWETLRTVDENLMRPPEKVEKAASATEVSVFLDMVESGEFDPYLENILAVAHERKRALRGHRTFDAPRRV